MASPKEAKGISYLAKRVLSTAAAALCSGVSWWPPFRIIGETLVPRAFPARAATGKVDRNRLFMFFR